MALNVTQFIVGLRGMWMREVWGPVLGRSLFGWLILIISNQQSLGLSLVGEVVSNVPNNWGLEHGHGGMSLDNYFVGDADPFL